MEASKMEIKVLRNAPESKLAELGVPNWKKWPLVDPPIKFSWTMNVKEKCYILQGKMRVYPIGPHKDDEYVEVSKGDLVEFPEGLKCTWDVSEPVERLFLHEV